MAQAIVVMPVAALRAALLCGLRTGAARTLLANSDKPIDAGNLAEFDNVLRAFVHDTRRVFPEDMHFTERLFGVLRHGMLDFVGPNLTKADEETVDVVLGYIQSIYNAKNPTDVCDVGAHFEKIGQPPQPGERVGREVGATGYFFFFILFVFVYNALLETITTTATSAGAEIVEIIAGAPVDSPLAFQRASDSINTDDGRSVVDDARDHIREPSAAQNVVNILMALPLALMPLAHWMAVLFFSAASSSVVGTLAEGDVYRTIFGWERPTRPRLEQKMDAHTCAVCGKEASKQCASCKAAFYCSAQCNESGWEEGHKDQCNK